MFNGSTFNYYIIFSIFLTAFAVFGVLGSDISSLERQFGLSSNEIGQLSSVYSLTCGICVLPVTIYGTRGHKPRILAAAAAIFGIGSFIMTVPHFAGDLYEYKHGIDTTQLCRNGW